MRTIALVLATACTVEPASIADDAPTEAPLRFGFPVLDPSMIEGRVGFDHDPVVQSSLLGSAICTDYVGRGFPNCYDEHDGSDFTLRGGFDAMDAGSVEIVAAQDGVVVDAHDGEYDRCHPGDGGISCDGFPVIGNQVTLEHRDGSRTLYWHMKKGSVARQVGDEVACGDVLGSIGSSGYSSLPHVHFEFVDADGVVTDPYAGPESQEESFWAEQNDPSVLPGPGCTAE